MYSTELANVPQINDAPQSVIPELGCLKQNFDLTSMKNNFICVHVCSCMQCELCVCMCWSKEGAGRLFFAQSAVSKE